MWRVFIDGSDLNDDHQDSEKFANERSLWKESIWVLRRIDLQKHDNREEGKSYRADTSVTVTQTYIFTQDHTLRTAAEQAFGGYALFDCGVPKS